VADAGKGGVVDQPLRELDPRLGDGVVVGVGERFGERARGLVAAGLHRLFERGRTRLARRLERVLRILLHLACRIAVQAEDYFADKPFLLGHVTTLPLCAASAASR
jgi:hypothetical protein